jgi:hypothetical protein
MLKILLASALGGMVISTAHAEDKTCAVKGMHCDACVELVTSKVCDQTKYSTCEVKILSEKKTLGQIHLVTKDKAAKIDENAVGSAIKDSGYNLDKCKMNKADGGSKTKS